MSEVRVKENESLDSALKRFKRNCAKAGVLADLRKKEYYQSPSVKRRKKSEAARKNTIARLSRAVCAGDRIYFSSTRCITAMGFARLVVVGAVEFVIMIRTSFALFWCHHTGRTLNVA